MLCIVHSKVCLNAKNTKIGRMRKEFDHWRWNGILHSPIRREDKAIIRKLQVCERRSIPFDDERMRQ